MLLWTLVRVVFHAIELVTVMPKPGFADAVVPK